MTSRFGRRLLLGLLLAGAAATPAVFAQGTTERTVVPLTLPLDKVGIWTLHFRYKPPRIVTVDALDDKGQPTKKLVWYMWFQVYNMPTETKAPDGSVTIRPAEPVYFIPEFELVTKDVGTVHLDEPQPFIVDQIKRLEDRTISKEQPDGVLNLQSTISISKRPIPPSKPDAIPRMVSGVAVWTDMPGKAPGTNRFSVYVTGLSNGLATEPTKGGEVLIKRKTLQLNFIRPTDDNRPDITDIRPDDATGPAEQWIYRTASKIRPTIPVEQKKDDGKKDEGKNNEK